MPFMNISLNIRINVPLSDTYKKPMILISVSESCEHSFPVNSTRAPIEDFLTALHILLKMSGTNYRRYKNEMLKLRLPGASICLQE